LLSERCYTKLVVVRKRGFYEASTPQYRVVALVPFC
jgi:hypothetical protein